MRIKNRLWPKSYFLIFAILLSSQLVMHPLLAAEKSQIQWELELHFDETDDTHDQIRFGEATNAIHHESPDSYDLPKPPPPLTPNIYSFFTNNFPEPYNRLQDDYRPYNQTKQIYNFTVIWTPEDYTSPTEITISWSQINQNYFPYTAIILSEDSNNSEAIDMMMNTNYTYTASANIPYNFKIQCSHLSDTSTNVPMLSIAYPILIVLLYILFKKT